ncbi:hypothetical protein WA026_001130 [Henosepilachna vigintioctopunctata]|uniref:Ribosomal protein S4 n=1 Tax=Henosepilachna vigintioctopunctata TaxID=420089 RepID=A0AAW1V727_9CUCU
MPIRPLSSISRDEMIRTNLMHLEQNIIKKKIAQAHFYDKQIECAPLVCNFQDKVPIHNRLGLFNVNKHKVPLFETNTNSFSKNKRIRKYKNRRRYTAQDRLLKIRQQQNINRSPMLFTKSFLRRILMGCNIPSLKMELVKDMKHSEISRFKLCLDHVYQEQIRQIQLSHPRQIIHGVHPIIPVATNITMNERFSHLL